MNPVHVLALAAGLSCGLGLPPVQAQLPGLSTATDDNPDPAVVETVLVAKRRALQLVPGNKTDVLTYNGTVPGPTIHANVGDRVVVHLVNLLDEPTTIHWHGIETPAVMDGSELSQAVVPASGHFRYEFVVNNAGTYWYHPHTDNTNEQIERGLYGALIVHDPQQDAALGIPPERDLVLFLDDVRLDDDQRIAPFATDPTAEFVPWQRAEDLVNSRVGTHMLLNGRWLDPKHPPGMEVQAGAPYRIRMISVTSGHLWRLSVGLQNARWYAIGSDQGLWNAPELIRPIGRVKDVRGHHNQDISNPDPAVGATLTPSDRLETVLLPHGEAGATVVLEGHDFIKGKHISFRGPDGELGFGHDHFDGAGEALQLIRFEITGAAAAAWQMPAQLRSDPVRRIAVDPSLPTLPVFFGHGLPHRDTGDVMFFLNVTRGRELLEAVHARKVVLPVEYLPLPMMKLRARDGYHVKVGEARTWEVVNFTGSDHNFHTHGFPFQHVETETIDLDEPANNTKEKARRLANEDTIRIPKRPGLVLGRSYTIVRLATRFDDSDRPAVLRRAPDDLLAGGLAPAVGRSGGWMVHCHFLEHGSKGMMSFITVNR